jgi:hypothetical protein
MDTDVSEEHAASVVGIEALYLKFRLGFLLSAWRL